MGYTLLLLPPHYGSRIINEMDEETGEPVVAVEWVVPRDA